MVENRTPHTITLIAPDGVAIVIPPCGVVARVEMTPAPARVPVAGLPVPVVRTVPGTVTGLPEPRCGDCFGDVPRTGMCHDGSLIGLLVSRVVAEAVRARIDLLVPDDLVRDAAGAVVGARRLAVIGGRP
jgi:hypothetical protein